jgi:serine/threonine protein kinase
MRLARPGWNQVLIYGCAGTRIEFRYDAIYDQPRIIHAKRLLERSSAVFEMNAPDLSQERQGNEPFQGTERFEVVRRIGAGGMGVVYEVHDRRRDMRVALKTLPRFDAAALYRFKQEFRALAGVFHHNLVTLHELISDGDCWFFTMELVEGVSFLEYARHGKGADREAAEPTRSHSLVTPVSNGDRQNPLSMPADPVSEPTSNYVAGAASAPVGEPAGDTVDFGPTPILDVPAKNPRNAKALSSPEQFLRLRAALQQLADGVIALHEAGKIHRDIKPSNVLVTPAGRTVLLDFGLAMELDSTKQGDEIEGLVSGTVNYMAPEQAAGQPLTGASDWYSVGVMLYVALTGKLPHAGKPTEVMWAKRVRKPLPPHSLNPLAPEDLTNLCQHLLQIDPRDRPDGRQILRYLSGDDDPGAGSATLPAATPFVGRERHLSRLGSAYEDIKTGKTVVMYVHGRSGTGKSLLLQRFLDDLPRRENAIVLMGRCYEQESVPYKALDSLIDALSRHLGRLAREEAAELMPRNIAALARLFPVLGRVEAVAQAPRPTLEIPDVHELRRRAFVALRELLARLGDRRRLILYIDDLQWGDVDSAALLVELLRPPDAPVLFLIYSYRSEYAATSPCLGALLESRLASDKTMRSEELVVGPLEGEDARKLALELLGGADPIRRSRAEAIARESAGSPYFVQELVKFAGDTPSGEVAAEGITLEEVLWRRVERLPAGARQLLEVISVSGRPLRQGDAYQAASLSVSDLGALNILRAGHFVRSTGASEVDDVEPFHDRVRETVSARLHQERLREHHGRLSQVLEGTGRYDPETLAVHFLGAGNSEKAGHYYSDAAEAAAQALAFDRAATLYGLALKLQSTADGGLRTKLADALANAGRGPDAAREYAAAAANAAGTQRIELERRAAFQFCRSGHLDEGRATLRTVLERVGMRLPATQGKALAALLTNRFRFWWRGQKYRLADPTQVSAEELARIDVSWSVAAGLGTKNIVVAPAFMTRNLLMALDAGEPFRLARALAWEASQVANEGGSARPKAERLLAEARVLAKKLGSPYIDGLVALAGGILEFQNGCWRPARTSLEQAVQIFRERCTGAAWELGQANSFLLWSLQYLGECAEMASRSSQVLKEANETGDRFIRANLGTSVEPLVLLAADRANDAVQIITDSLRPWSHEEYNLQHLTALMGSTFVDLYRGEAAGAYKRLLEQWPSLKKALMLQAQICRVFMLEFRVRSGLALALETPERKRLLDNVGRDLKKMDRERMPYGQALAQAHRGALAHQLGDHDAARRHLVDAVERLTTVGMALYAAAARYRLGECVGGHEGEDLIQVATAWMRGQKIKNPSRMVAALTPGLHRNQ